MPDQDRALSWTTLPAAVAAAALPSLLAFNLPPSPTFLNQALAFLCWGSWAATIGHALRRAAPSPAAVGKAMALPGIVLGVLALEAIGSSLWGSLPRSLLWSNLATLSGAAVLAAAGACAGAAPLHIARSMFAAFCLAWVTAGLLNVAVALIQVFAPHWADGDWIARSALPGRAVGNLRQPNHLCTLLLWAMIAAVALRELSLMKTRALLGVLALLAWALVLTASRTAIVGVMLLTLWGALDSGLSRPARASLMASPIFFALAWAAMALWSGLAQEAFGAQERLAEADLSASRFRIWSDSVRLIAANPLQGVGFGEFNFAWSLSVLPQRPPAFFDHAHNLFLHWAVELGLPVASLLSALLLMMLWRIGHGARRSLGSASALAALPLRITLALLLMMGLHSQLEYPLWYAYFLLPTAWLLGWGLALAADAAKHRGAAHVDARTRAAAPGPRSPLGIRALVIAASAVVLASAASVADYTRVAVIFDADSPQPLGQRMARGQRSLLFAHHADYAAATTGNRPEQELPAFGRAAHYLLDTRLMTAWADAWAASGDLARAQHLAARLREFRNPNSAEYFAPCVTGATASASPSGDAQPYQCATQAPSRLSFRDFR
jgi:O-antigen ligase